MDSREFVQELVDRMEELFAQLGEREALESESEGRVEIVTLLKLALKSEIEASEIAGSWMSSTPEIDVKLAFAEQCGDEMKHYNLISRRLAELGEEVSDHEGQPEPHSPFYQYLTGLRTSIERIAAGPFAMEAVAKVRNQQFIELCEALGDHDTARLYTEIIQPEEIHHHETGRELLEKYAVSDADQALAAAATRNSLAIADELRTLAEKSTGLSPIPVS